jgi:hypothetical protein
MEKRAQNMSSGAAERGNAQTTARCWGAATRTPWCPLTRPTTTTTPQPQGGNRTHLRNSVRAQFRANAALTDAGAIDAAKAAAVRGLSNFMFHEAQRLAQADAAGVGDPKHDG